MAIKTLEQKKRQQILIFVAFGILIIAVIVLYFGVWKDSGGPGPSGEMLLPEGGDEEITTDMDMDIEAPAVQRSVQRSGLILEERLNRVDLDFTFLTETILPFLKSHGELPVQKGETGRSNPFIPY